MKTATLALPAYYASALINNDYSGLSNIDKLDIEKALSANKLASCLSVSDSSFTGRYNDLLTDLATYTFEVLKSQSVKSCQGDYQIYLTDDVPGGEGFIIRDGERVVGVYPSGKWPAVDVIINKDNE